MKSLSELEEGQAEWIQPKSFERSYQLKWRDEVLARLSFRSRTGTLATGETAEGRWTFKRVGFLNPRITVRSVGSEEDLAVYQPKFWGDGVLSFKDGPVFAWRPANFWSTAWEFIDPEGTVTIAFQPGVEKERLRDIFRTQFTVTFHQIDRIWEAAPLLAILGMYLLILHQEDAAAAGALAATTAAV